MGQWEGSTTFYTVIIFLLAVQVIRPVRKARAFYGDFIISRMKQSIDVATAAPGSLPG